MMAKAFSILFLPLALSSFLASDLRSTESMISEAGYKAESHKVVTPDQYILTMYRIVGNGPVVFMQHGMVGSSTAWLLAGANHGAPAFRLAEQGYDVWLGNFRGNHESRDHMTLDPDTDDEFWQFSQDEMSKYDLPSQLNYVLQSTKKEKIFYVGHSMGTTTYMAMNSMDQSWSEKVELAIFLAPVAYVGHMRSPVKLLAPFSDQVQFVVDHMGLGFSARPGEFLPSNWMNDLLTHAACGSTPLQPICKNAVFLFVGFDESQMNRTMLPVMTGHYASGTSSYTVLQYAQGMKHNSFRGFDWGTKEKNIEHHGSAKPPQYDLSKINTKVALFWGDNDWLAAKEDLCKILTQVPTVVVNYQVPWRGWNHIDHLSSIDIDKYQNNYLLNLLEMYSNE